MPAGPTRGAGRASLERAGPFLREREVADGPHVAGPGFLAGSGPGIDVIN